MKAEAGNCGAAKRQKWKDKVKTKGFTMRPLTQRRNTGFIWAERNDRCHPGDWQVAASTAHMKSPGRDVCPSLNSPLMKGRESPKGK